MDKALADQMKQKLFGWKVVKSKYELIPLIAALSVACGMAVAFSAYSLWQKPDVRLNKKGHASPPWEEVDPEQRQKLIVFNQQYQKIPELEQLRKEIGSYKY
jgi:hypothetical protein